MLRLSYTGDTGLLSFDKQGILTYAMCMVCYLDELADISIMLCFH